MCGNAGPRHRVAGRGLTGSMTTHTCWWSTNGSGEIETAIEMSTFRKTCWSESKARPASSLPRGFIRVRQIAV
jgi:hypothetical protein